MQIVQRKRILTSCHIFQLAQRWNVVYCSVNCCVLKRDKATLSILLKQKYTVMLLYTFHLHCSISFSGTSLHWSSKLLHQTTLPPEFTAGKLYANVVKQTVDSTTSSSCCNLTFVSTNQNCLQHRISQSQLKWLANWYKKGHFRTLPSTACAKADEIWQPANIHAASVLTIGATLWREWLLYRSRVTVAAERSLSTWPTSGKQKIIIIMQVSVGRRGRV